MEGSSEIVAGIESFRGSFYLILGEWRNKQMVLHKQKSRERPVKPADPYPWKAVLQSTVHCVRAGTPLMLHSFSLWPRHQLESRSNSLAKMCGKRFCYYLSQYKPHLRPPILACSLPHCFLCFALVVCPSFFCESFMKLEIWSGFHLVYAY